VGLQTSADGGVAFHFFRGLPRLFVRGKEGYLVIAKPR
jgi:hypothetical protein